MQTDATILMFHFGSSSGHNQWKHWGYYGTGRKHFASSLTKYIFALWYLSFAGLVVVANGFDNKNRKLKSSYFKVPVTRPIMAFFFLGKKSPVLDFFIQLFFNGAYALSYSFLGRFPEKPLRECCFAAITLPFCRSPRCARKSVRFLLRLLSPIAIILQLFLVNCV